MSEIFDNIENRKVDAAINKMLTSKNVQRADFCVGYFNLRGWKLVAENIDKLPGAGVIEFDSSSRPKRVNRVCRLLIGMHSMPFQYVKMLYTSKANTSMDSENAAQLKRTLLQDLRRQLTYGFQTTEDEKALQFLQRQLEEKKVVVKVHLHNPLHAKLYLAYKDENDVNPIDSIMGSSNLTVNGLIRNGELNAGFPDQADAKQFADWFALRWNDKFSLDITEELVKILDESWASANKPTPYEIYLKIMFHLSREAASGIADYSIPSVFANELYDFQKTAVQLILRHLKKRGGAMLGDVVGLGKTISACAVAKYYEERHGSSTLVLCPPNLTEMWKTYADKYDLKMKVKSMAGNLDANQERFYKLVIIDESHNMRNNGGKRYALVHDFIKQQENDVLLLTATPFNKDYSDIASQLELFMDPDEDLGMRPERLVRELGGEQLFTLKYSDVLISSLNAFEESSFSDDWRDLLKLYLVRRTRTFIKNNYALPDEKDPSRRYLPGKNGSRNYFPARIPKTIKFETSPGDSFERLYSETIMDAIGDMKLPRYGLSAYISKTKKTSATPKETEILNNLTSAGKRLIGFCRSGFGKRMDSSGIVFLMSLYRHAVRNAMFLHAIKNKLDIPVRAGVELDEGFLEDEDGEGNTSYSFPTDNAHYIQAGQNAYEYLKLTAPSSVKWISSSFFTPSLATKLKADNEIIFQMLEHCGAWNPDEDKKLFALKKLVAEKHPHEKVLIFTQYKDTAQYLAKQLRDSGIENVDQVDGDTDNMVQRVNRFSPRSNNVLPIPDGETRVLIATDTLSEGQNLQDAHIVVNYDLPWAIIRLIQRAGRVDRIGQKAEKVFCYSFFPQEGVDRIINLVDRLNERINNNADAVGSDEVFFEGNKQNLKDVFNEKADILDDEQDDGDVDIASQAYQIWEKAVKGKPDLARRIMSLPNVVYSAKPAGTFTPGVITYAKSPAGNDMLSWYDADKKFVSGSFTEILEAIECSRDTPRVAPLANHHEIVKQALCDIPDEMKTPTSAGAMGTRKTVRFKLFELLQIRLRDEGDSLFSPIWQKIANDVYQYPLRESAKATLHRLWSRGEGADNILIAAQKLHNDDALCAKPTLDDINQQQNSAQVICSMGLAN